MIFTIILSDLDGFATSIADYFSKRVTVIF